MQVRQSFHEPVEYLAVDLFAGTFDRLAGPLDELVDADVVAGDAENRALQQPAVLQPVEGLKRHLAGQVAGDSENYQQVRGVGAGFSQSGPPREIDSAPARHVRTSP